MRIEEAVVAMESWSYRDTLSSQHRGIREAVVALVAQGSRTGAATMERESGRAGVWRRSVMGVVTRLAARARTATPTVCRAAVARRRAADCF